ncbi:MAG: hypothetical protein AAF447_16590 [Myxococcota bacterium]
MTTQRTVRAKRFWGFELYGEGPREGTIRPSTIDRSVVSSNRQRAALAYARWLERTTSRFSLGSGTVTVGVVEAESDEPMGSAVGRHRQFEVTLGERGFVARAVLLRDATTIEEVA